MTIVFTAELLFTIENRILAQRQSTRVYKDYEIMPESQIILQMIAIVLLVWVPIAGGVVFLIWAVKKTIWHGMTKTKSNGMASTESNGMTSIKSKGTRLAVFIGAAVGGVLPGLSALRLGEGFHVWRIILTSLFGAFCGGLIALFVGSIASARRKPK